MVNDARRRGKNAKITGDVWEREWIHDFHEATAIKLSRQLLERREGNLGDIEIHERVPFVFQCRKRQQVSTWKALEDADEIAAPIQNYPCGVLQVRTGSNGKPNPRAIAMYHDDFVDMVETFKADPDRSAPSVVFVRKYGTKYPRVWDGLAEAQNIVAQSMAGSVAVCQGFRNDQRTVVLIDYPGFLKIVGELYERRLW